MNACEQSRVNAKARGYIGELEWLEVMSKGHTQSKCPKCNLFHLWKKKTKSMDTSSKGDV